MRLNGVSRTQRINRRHSFKQTSAARSIRFEAMPLAIPASVPIVHGSTIIPSERQLPLATLAPMSASECCTILFPEAAAPSSFSTNPLRPLSCISSAKTRNAASDGIKSTLATRVSASSARSISAAKIEPLAPVTARVSLRLDDSDSVWRVTKVIIADSLVCHSRRESACLSFPKGICFCPFCRRLTLNHAGRAGDAYHGLYRRLPRVHAEEAKHGETRAIRHQNSRSQRRKHRAHQPNRITHRRIPQLSFLAVSNTNGLRPANPNPFLQEFNGREGPLRKNSRL